jgi:hypothetical protein
MCLLLSFHNKVNPQEVMHLITGLNLRVETIIVGVTSDPNPDQSDMAINTLYLVGLKNLMYRYNYLSTLLKKELSPHIVEERT